VEARIGDGYCTVGPDADAVKQCRSQGARGKLVHTADMACGPDIGRHVEAIAAYADAGFDVLYVNQIGPDQNAFFAAYRDRVLPCAR
jgi:hypothetical protein